MSRSSELFERAKRVLAGGVSRNTLLREPHPLYAKSVNGCRVTDLDGVERVDFANNMAALIHGHAHPAIVEAVAAQLSRGSAYTMASEVEVEFAEHMVSRFPWHARMRFVNSGTEAVMTGVKAARAFTGRPRLAKVEGTYHGSYDYAEVSQAPGPDRWGEYNFPNSVPLAAGTPHGVLRDTIILPFNHPRWAREVLDQHREEIACVLVDPMPHRTGLVPASQAFLQALRDWTREDGALLLFDEVITFRTEVGGMQERHLVKPDLTAMGKMIGGGFPVGAVAGSDKVMQVFAREGQSPQLPHSGTFSGNPITMTAGLTAMRMFDRAAVEKLNKLGDYTRMRLKEVIAETGLPASVTGAGSAFRIHMKAEPPKDYRHAWPTEQEKQAERLFIRKLYDNGILIVGTGAGFLSTPMGEEEVEILARAVDVSLRESWAEVLAD
ncbi:MAG: aspartate aminotransferase family protein [Planctomycetota bacterium]|nr:MAG: aspartate aminotransferase family protein [Planctomycetota bacterium]